MARGSDPGSRPSPVAHSNFDSNPPYILSHRHLYFAHSSRGVAILQGPSADTGDGVRKWGGVSVSSGSATRLDARPSSLLCSDALAYPIVHVVVVTKMLIGLEEIAL